MESKQNIKTFKPNISCASNKQQDPSVAQEQKATFGLIALESEWAIKRSYGRWLGPEEPQAPRSHGSFVS